MTLPDRQGGRLYDWLYALDEGSSRRRVDTFVMRNSFGILAILALGTVLILPIHPPRADSIYFDDFEADVMRLGNTYYELTLDKANGAILSLVDRNTGVPLTLGSRYGCLWGAVFPTTTPDYVGGCSYDLHGPNYFTYTWDSVGAILTLTYTWDSSAVYGVDATVTISAYEAPYFDLHLALKNDWGGTMGNAILPSDLLFRDEDVESAYAPFLLPGIRLKAGFFTEDRTYVPTYPSDAAFADYLALEVNGSYLTLYTLNPDGPIQPVALGFVDDDAHHPDTFFSYHSFHTWVEDGEIYNSPTVRIRVGQPPVDTLLAYREENGIAAYPSLTEKLGDRFALVVQAPLIKADAWHINKSFRDWIPDLERLPSPALLHPVAFQPGGHDENYPDFLPPDSRWGTTADFRALVEAAHTYDLLVMPYTNPTWWDDESPTMQNLPPPLTASDVAVLEEDGEPVYETYNGHGGYVVSPQIPFVQQRLAQLMYQWETEVPVDFVFEDQIGARVWRYDFNPDAPSPLAYSDGWVAHTHTYTDQGLMTEFGFDRLAETEIGFHGSVLTWAREFDYADQHWGAENWETWPLALWLFHDKVLFYQHNLSNYTMSEEKSILTWNLAFGYLLSYDWQWADNDPLGNPWLDPIAALQRAVIARYAGRPLTDFTHISDWVTRTTFGDLSIVANWDPLLTYEMDGHRLAPMGFMAETEDGGLLAGVFVRLFNGSELSAGEHYLIVERNPSVVIVRQPVGEETALTVGGPFDWKPGEPLRVWVFDRAGNLLGEAPFWVDEMGVHFIYHREWEGEEVGWYELVKSSIYLPMIAYDKDSSPSSVPMSDEWLARMESGGW